MKIVSAAEYKAKGFRKLQEEAAQPAAPDVAVPDDMARASLALMSRVFTPTEELIEYRQKRLDAMLAGDLTDDARTSLGYAAEQLERARYLHAKGAADVDIATVLEVIDLRLKDVVVVAAANIGLAAGQEKAEQKMADVANGKAGAKKRHAASEAVKAHVLAEYRKGEWKSKKDAARKLTPLALEKAGLEHFTFAHDGAENRVYLWILEGAKEK